MRLHTAADLLDGEHRSQVDRVRITPRPPYARTATWFNWASPGGWSWTYAWLYVLLLLFIWGMLHGYNHSRGQGTEFGLPGIRLGAIKVQRLIGGQPIRDNSGTVLLDPRTTGVTVLSIDSTGRVELRYRNDPRTPESRETVIIIPDKDCQYRHVVRAIDEIDSGDLDFVPAPNRVWLAAPQ